jgi:hypothetical protein
LVQGLDPAIPMAAHPLQSRFRTQQSTREKCLIKFQVRSHLSVFLPQQERPQQSENKSPAAPVLTCGCHNVFGTLVVRVLRRMIIERDPRKVTES